MWNSTSFFQAMPGIRFRKDKTSGDIRKTLDRPGWMPWRQNLKIKLMDYQSQSANHVGSDPSADQGKELQDPPRSRIDGISAESPAGSSGETAGSCPGHSFEKAKAAVKEVAKENKYTYILNPVHRGMWFLLHRTLLMYHMPLVKKKLGIANWFRADSFCWF